MSEKGNRSTVRTNNPVRISRIGADRLQVFIRPADGCAELLALVERLEQLIDAGYDAIDVVFESATTQGLAPMRRPAHGRAPEDTAMNTDHAHGRTR